MEKIKSYFYDISLKKSLVLLVIITLLAVIGLSSLTIFFTAGIRQEKLDSRDIYINTATIVQEEGEVYQITPIEDNYQYGELTGRNKFIYYLATIGMAALPTLYIIMGTVFIVSMYYHLKLAYPLQQLNNGIQNITSNNLDFKITYDSKDELGMLCMTLENMRHELYLNNQKLWQLLDERKALTSSVSHDLRTPITVIKGYLDYLRYNLPQGKVSNDVLFTTLERMSQSTMRLERYVECIKDIQKIEDIEIAKEIIEFSEFIQRIRGEFEIVANKYEKNFIVNDHVYSNYIMIDHQIIFRILENILNNAFRFAKENIILEINEKEDYLEFMVQDDGPGFSLEDLENAVTLFYSSKINQGMFGIGLSISKILCEKHDGVLKLSNNETGGCVLIKIKK